MSGPVPKRSDQRVRRNKDVVGIDTVQAVGEVKVPRLGLDNPHSMVVDFWDSLTGSAQSQYYEPSDWQYARWTLYWMDSTLKSGKPSAILIQTINQAFGELMVSEGSRRRLRMEVERASAQAEVVDIAEVYRERLSRPS